MEGFFCCRFTKYSTVAYLFGPTHLFELIKNEIISLNLRSFPMVFHFSAGYDPERVTETVPTSSGHDQTGQSWCSSWRVYDDPSWDRAPHPHLSRPSRPRTVGPRCQWIQPRSILARCGPRSQASHGIPTLRAWCPQVHRPKPSHFADEIGHGYDPATLLFQPGSDLPTCTNGSNAPTSTVWCTHNFSWIIRHHELFIAMDHIYSY